MKIQTLTILPDTPKPLSKLKELSYNVYYSWNEEVEDLFKILGTDLWVSCGKNPVRFLSEVPLETLEEFAKNKDFITQLDSVYQNYQNYLKGETWFAQKYKHAKKESIAYFSCEFGLDSSIPIYSGGLGILAGDHIKSASDLGLPLVGVGLFYHRGYFNQRIDSAGTQIEYYPTNNLYDLPVKPVTDDKNENKIFSIQLGDKTLCYQIWQLDVGRVKIYLLDAKLPQNPPEFQNITDHLYDGNRETRIQQEYLLGIGGFRALLEMGHSIEAFHINEGHSAFLLLEYVYEIMQTQNLDFESAKTYVRNTSCFTTHTPVPAGNERFNIFLIERYFKNVAQKLNISWDLFLSLGRENPSNNDEEFCLTVLAFKLCSRNNGVSKLHGEVSRDMWQNLYPKVPRQEVPIGSVTNGVHGQTWTHHKLKEKLLEKTEGDSKNLLFDVDLYKNIFSIDDKELWEWKNECRNNLVDYARLRLLHQHLHANAGQIAIERSRNILNPKALTIGFARRFATYKRGNLFLRNPERLVQIMKNAQFPVQIVLAGKAHPADQYGKDIIKSIHNIAHKYGLEDNILFLSNYNIDIAKQMVSGVDVWLNTPIKPQEASGTSGMKAAINGSLNLSVADGWWAEAYNPNVGWRLDTEADIQDQNIIDDLEADKFYDYLEQDIVPMFYNRDANGVPKLWLAMMKQSIAQVGAYFNSIRMLKEYVEDFYIKAIHSSQELQKNNFKLIHDLNEWKTKIYAHWDEVSIKSLNYPQDTKLSREDTIIVKANVVLGNLSPKDVSVECYHGILDSQNEIENGVAAFMEHTGAKDQLQSYEVTLSPNKGGKYGYTIRVLPKHKSLVNSLNLGLVRWYE